MISRDKNTARATLVLALMVMFGVVQSGWAQAALPPLNIFKNYFVTGDYVVGGWVEASSNGTYATGAINIPDNKQPLQAGVNPIVPKGAIVVAAYLYWGTVEGSKTLFKGQQAFFNGYQIVGDVLGDPNAPTSWSSGGCTGNSAGSKTIRFYRADVRPFLPIDATTGLPMGGGTPDNPMSIAVKIADSGSNGNTQPNALGASLVVIYRVLNPPTTLNAIVLYDGSYAPFNSAPNTLQTMVGFYQPSSTPIAAKLTHIVANGQPNKGETVSFGPDPNTFGPANVLPPLYTATFGQNSPPFPGLYGGMWDNPTWSVGNLMNTADTSETTTVVPSSSNSGCVDWGAMILSTTVQDTDGDGLLDIWEINKGYTDAISGNFVALPKADPQAKDIFVELDYLVNYLADGVTVQHSHLPKQAALDAVGTAFSSRGINVHFDVGNVYQGDPFVITNGTGGNSIPESALLCTDNGKTPPFCPFLGGQPSIAWKGGVVFVRDTATMPGTNAPLGNFQPGRGQSYHYVLSGHSLGEPRSFWSTYGTALADSTTPQLNSIVNSGKTATVTIQTPVLLSPQGVTVYPKPGDCPNALITGCGDLGNDRVTILGSLNAPFVPGPNPQPAPPLNGTYLFKNAHSSDSVVNGVNVTITTFTITTSGVADGTYNFSNEPQLAVSYLGPSSSSGHSDFGGGGDSAITLGLWGADDVANCQPDPSQQLGGFAAYCNNQVGTLNQQIGTLLHEMGHSLTLTHGGVYYNDGNNPSVATYEVNCKPNFLSVMSYLFQVRGFVDGGFDYSGQTMPALNETTTPAPPPPPGILPIPGLSELAGIGTDSGNTAAHLTRWYSNPNTVDQQLQNTTGGRYARAHCDGSPLTFADVPGVRVDGTIPAPGPYSTPLDWNNDLVAGDDPINPPGIDINYNGSIGDAPFSGFNDWKILNPADAGDSVALQQMSARWNAFGASGAGGIKTNPTGGIKTNPTGGIDNDGGGAGIKINPTGGIKTNPTGGMDVNEDVATATVEAPLGLNCTTPLSGAVVCVASTPPLFIESGRSVPLSWSYPGSTQIRFAYLYRALGSFPTQRDVQANFSKFALVKPAFTGAPPTTSFVDTSVKNNNTYTYVLTDKNKQGALSPTSTTPLVVFVKP